MKIIREVVNAIELEIIILFGSHARGDEVDEAQMGAGGIDARRSDFDILVVTAHRRIARKTGKWYRVKELIRQSATVQTPVTIIPHEICFINKNLRRGHYFFTDIQNEGILLYDSGRRQLAPARDLNPEECRKRAAEDFKQLYTSAISFLAGFQQAFDRTDYRKAALALHQAVEHFYSTILLVYTGYRPNRHDLDVLGYKAAFVEPRVLTVFPNTTAKEKRCFKLLCDAYVHSRSNRKYKITREELTWLNKKVKELQELIEEVCREKIANYTKNSDTRKKAKT